MTNSKLPKGYKVVPSYPDYAVSDKGEVLNVRTHYQLAPFSGSDGEDSLVIYTIDPESHKNRRTVVKVSDMIKDANDADGMLNRYIVTLTDFDNVIQAFSVHRDELGNFIKAIEWGHINTIHVEPIAVVAPWEIAILNSAEEEQTEIEWRPIPGYPDVEIDPDGNVRYTDDQTWVSPSGSSPRGVVQYHLEDHNEQVSTYTREYLINLAFPNLKKD